MNLKISSMWSMSLLLFKSAYHENTHILTLQCVIASARDLKKFRTIEGQVLLGPPHAVVQVVPCPRALVPGTREPKVAPHSVCIAAATSLEKRYISLTPAQSCWVSTHPDSRNKITTLEPLGAERALHPEKCFQWTLFIKTRTVKWSHHLPNQKSCPAGTTPGQPTPRGQQLSSECAWTQRAPWC